MASAAWIDAAGGDGWAYLESESSADRAIRMAMADKAHEFLEVRAHNATVTGVRGKRG